MLVLFNFLHICRFMDGLPCIGRGIWLVRAELFSFHFADTQLVFFLQSSTLLDEYGNGNCR